MNTHQHRAAWRRVFGKLDKSDADAADLQVRIRGARKLLDDSMTEGWGGGRACRQSVIAAWDTAATSFGDDAIGHLNADDYLSRATPT